jgi:hypothetical protein
VPRRRAKPPLSIVIGTGEGWPYVRDLVAVLRPEVEKLGAEMIFADGSGNAVPGPDDIGSNTRWLSIQAPSVFALYAAGISEARGEIVATTEDHALPRAGWCAAIVNAHAAHPEAAAIGGAIENGSTDGLIEWASYFTTQGPHMAPLGDQVVPMTTNEANVSYKRTAVADLDDNAGLGFMAILHNRRLAESGAILRVDDRMVVDHFETAGFGPTTTIHFHNGKSIAGFRRAKGMSPEDWARMATALLLPAWRTARVLRVGLRKHRLRRELLASAPLALWLEYVQGTGSLMGYLLGPGDSPSHLR